MDEQNQAFLQFLKTSCCNFYLTYRRDQDDRVNFPEFQSTALSTFLLLHPWQISGLGKSQKVCLEIEESTSKITISFLW